MGNFAKVTKKYWHRLVCIVRGHTYEKTNVIWHVFLKPFRIWECTRCGNSIRRSE